MSVNQIRTLYTQAGTTYFFTPRSGVTHIFTTASGGGGAGGDGALVDGNVFCGGGGGAGGMVISSPIVINSTNRTLQCVVGRGGQFAGENGGNTTISVLNEPRSFVFEGGRAGGSGLSNAGGAAGLSAGMANPLVNAGANGSPSAGGDGGASNFGRGGLGGNASAVNGTSAILGMGQGGGGAYVGGVPGQGLIGFIWFEY